MQLHIWAWFKQNSDTIFKQTNMFITFATEKKPEKNKSQDWQPDPMYVNPEISPIELSGIYFQIIGLKPATLTSHRPSFMRLRTPYPPPLPMQMGFQYTLEVLIFRSLLLMASFQTTLPQVILLTCRISPVWMGHGCTNWPWVCLMVEIAAGWRSEAAGVEMMVGVIKGMDGMSTNHSCEWT